MKSLLKKYFIIILAVYSLTQFIPAFVISDRWQGLFYSSFILSILFYIAQPIINLIMLPINLLTLNLTSWLLNIVITYIWTLLVPNIQVASWQFKGKNIGPITFSSLYFPQWQVIVLSGILLTLIIQFIKWLVK